MSGDIPAYVLALRHTLLRSPDHANRIIDAARANAVETRFAPSPLPAPGLVPYAAERFCGARFRWLSAPGPHTETHEVDGFDRVVTSTAPGPRQHFFEYTETAVHRVTLTDGAVVELAITTLRHGQPVGYVEVSRASWLREDYDYDAAGVLLCSRQRYHLVATGIPDGVTGQRTDHYIHAADGRLTQVRTTLVDQPTEISYQA